MSQITLQAMRLSLSSGQRASFGRLGVSLWIGDGRYFWIALEIRLACQLCFEFRSPVLDLTAFSAVLSIEIVELIAHP